MAQELAIATHRLTKQFERQIAVNDVELRIAAGEVYGLIGPNGAGKTTLIRMLATADEPTVGEIYLFGERLQRDHRHAHLKQHLGYLPDDFPLYDDLTVWDYLDYFARLYHLRQPQRRRRLHEVLELVQLTNKKDSLIATLSRGMKQRLSLARTIIHEPILLLLDEPVSGLDPIARMQFRQIIKILQEAGMTILISSHVLSDLAELCSSVGIMELGYLVESTPLQELYARLARQQIVIYCLDRLDDLEKAIADTPWVTQWQRLSDRPGIKLNFTGGDNESAILLKQLIEQDFKITNFQTIQEDLESIFLQLGHQQVS